jgi:hypothetical protein
MTRRRAILIVALLASTMLAGVPVAAQQTPPPKPQLGSCTLTAQGYNYVDGWCQVLFEKGKLIVRGHNNYGGVLTNTDGTLSGWVTHDHEYDEWGLVKFDGKCYTNAKFRLCAATYGTPPPPPPVASAPAPSPALSPAEQLGPFIHAYPENYLQDAYCVGLANQTRDLHLNLLNSPAPVRDGGQLSSAAYFATMQKMATLWQERSKGEWAHARNWDKAAMTPDLPIITQAVQEGSNTATTLSGPSFSHGRTDVLGQPLLEELGRCAAPDQ